MAEKFIYYQSLVTILRLSGLISRKTDGSNSWIPQRLVLIIYFIHVALLFHYAYYNIYNKAFLWVTSFVLLQISTFTCISLVLRRQSSVLDIFRELEDAADKQSRRRMRRLISIMCYFMSVIFICRAFIASAVLFAQKAEYDSVIREMGFQPICDLDWRICVSLVFVEAALARTLTIEYVLIVLFTVGAINVNLYFNLTSVFREIKIRSTIDTICTTEDITWFRKRYSALSCTVENIEYFISLHIGILCFVFGIAAFFMVFLVFRWESLHLSILSIVDFIFCAFVLFACSVLHMYVAMNLDDRLNFPIVSIRLCNCLHVASDVDFALQSEGLVQQLLDFPQLTLAKFFPVNRKVLVHVFGAIGTYVMVLVELDQDFQDFIFSFNGI